MPTDQDRVPVDPTIAPAINAAPSPSPWAAPSPAPNPPRRALQEDPPMTVRDPDFTPDQGAPAFARDPDDVDQVNQPEDEDTSRTPEPSEDE